MAQRLVRYGYGVAIGVALGCAAHAAAAQPARRADGQAFLRGSVVEDGTGQPLRMVEVAIELRSGHRYATRTNQQGAFVLMVPAGRHTVRARQIGFAEAHVDIDVVPGIDSARRVELFMEPISTTSAASLDAVTVTARAAMRASALQRVAERRFLGLGQFVEYDEIVRRGQPPLADLLRAVPGVSVAGSGPNAVLTMARARRGCYPVVFLDGTRVNRAFDPADVQQSVLAMIPGRTVEVVEIYRGPAETPAEFGGSSSPCGAVAVWTIQPTRPPR